MAQPTLGPRSQNQISNVLGASKMTRGDIAQAALRLSSGIPKTPFLRSATLSALAGCDIWIKFENLQFTASFKERGALNRLLELDDCARGVIAMSAGNHAQAVARHAHRLGVAATIVMPKSTPFTKIARTRAHGATVILEGEDLAAAAVFARARAAQEGLTFIHPYDDPLVIAGQGTVALEMLADQPDLDCILSPYGGGGLTAGCLLAAEGTTTAIIGVQSWSHSVAAHRLHGGDAPTFGATIAEGIAVRDIGEIPFNIARAHELEILRVDERMIERAVLLFAEIEKTIVEGAGAAGLAAVLTHPQRFAGRKIGLIASGGNIDARMLANVLMRGLARDGRLLQIKVEVPDKPGALASLTAAIARARGNVVDVQHGRWFGAGCANIAEVAILAEAQDAAHGQEIMEILAQEGFSPVLLG